MALIDRFRGRRAALGRLADEELIALVRERDADAFEAIFDRHAGAAYSLAYRMCGIRELAEEVVQETFIGLWRRPEGYDADRGSLRAWLLVAARSRMLDAFRARARAPVTVPDEASAQVPGGADTPAEAIARDDAATVRRALGELPDEQRRVIELAYFGGLSHSEIATRLGLPAGTVKGRMRLGLEKLRAALAPPVDSVL